MASEEISRERNISSGKVLLFCIEGAVCYRAADQTYAVNEVNGAYKPGQPILVPARTFALSTFGDNTIFVGGNDCCGINLDEMAWIFKGGMKEVLDQSGVKRGE